MPQPIEALRFAGSVFIWPSTNPTLLEHTLKRLKDEGIDATKVDHPRHRPGMWLLSGNDLDYFQRVSAPKDQGGLPFLEQHHALTDLFEASPHVYAVPWWTQFQSDEQAQQQIERNNHVEGPISAYTQLRDALAPEGADRRQAHAQLAARLKGHSHGATEGSRFPRQIFA